MNKKIVIGVSAVVLIAAAGIAIAQHKSSAPTKESAQVTASVNQMLDDAAKYESQGDKLKAKEAYSKIVSDYPDYDKIEEIQQKLGDLNVAIITSNIQTPQTTIYQVNPATP